MAAASVGDIRLSQAAVLRVLQQLGESTDEELVFAYPAYQRTWGLPTQSSSGIRTRRAELVRAGLVEHTGGRRPISTGRLARIWRAIET